MSSEEFSKYLKAYPAKGFLIKEGDNSNDFFCLLEGKIGIWKGPPEEPTKLVRVGEISEKGSYFGEMSFMLNEARTASIIADEKVKVLQFPGEMLEQLIQKQPKLAVKMCKTLADRLKGTTSKTEEVAHHRDELRGDVSSAILEAKESYKRVFMLLTAIQSQFQHPLIKEVIDSMSSNKLIQGGRKQKVNKDFLKDLSKQLSDLVSKVYTQKDED